MIEQFHERPGQILGPILGPTREGDGTSEYAQIFLALLNLSLLGVGRKNIEQRTWLFMQADDVVEVIQQSIGQLEVSDIRGVANFEDFVLLGVLDCLQRFRVFAAGDSQMKDGASTCPKAILGNGPAFLLAQRVRVGSADLLMP